MENIKNKDIKRNILFGIIIFFLGCLFTFGIFYKFSDVFNIETTKVEKNVTITDTGIAESVDKVYSSVLVVQTYQQDTLYSSGSGFIYKNDDKYSYILTNYHVINGGNNYKITYTDGSVASATLVGGDEYSDIAILKVETKENYYAVTIGSTTDIKVGDTTFTVGAPLDNVYSWTVTRGIISGKERLVEIETSNNSEYMMSVIQTDAAVNSGNSGGPLCNANGEVIGVISAKISSTGVEGMGFAIPIETALEKADNILNGSKTEYPYLGISMMNLSDMKSYARYYNFLQQTNLENGVVIIDVENGSVASKANLQSKDIITKINDTDIISVAYLRYELYKHSIGDTITITYERNGKLDTVSVKLETNNSTM